MAGLQRRWLERAVRIRRVADVFRWNRSSKPCAVHARAINRLIYKIFLAMDNGFVVSATNRWWQTGDKSDKLRRILLDGIEALFQERFYRLKDRQWTGLTG